MTIMRTDENTVYKAGAVVSTQTVQVDITAEVNAQDLQTKATNAIATNNNFLAVASPTNAQAVAQVQALTRQNTAIVRLMLGLLDSTDGT